MKKVYSKIISFLLKGLIGHVTGIDKRVSDLEHKLEAHLKGLA